MIENYYQVWRRLGKHKKLIFCDEIKELNDFIWTNYIKQNIRKIIIKCYSNCESKLKYILYLFCKTRQPKNC